MGDDVDAADVAVEQVGCIDALTPDLGVKIETAVGKAPCADDFDHRQRQFLDGIGELVGVPSVLRIAAIGVD